MEKIGKSIVSKRRRWEWLGHVLRMDNNRHAKIAISWTPDGKRIRKRCRHKETWRRTIERERKDLGFQTWTDATKVAKERDKWKGPVKDPILLKDTVGNRSSTTYYTT